MSLQSLAKTDISMPRLRRKREDDPSGQPTKRAPRKRQKPTSPRGVVGLDIQPGEVVAAEVSLDGGIVVERAVSAEIEPRLVREGEVMEPEALGAQLKDFFAEHSLSTSVRVGIASQRAVMRIIDLPPLTDDGDIAAAVRLQAPEHIAMPLDRAVLDHHTIGTVDTSAGPRTRVVVVAAQRDSVAKLLTAIEHAGLRPVGMDLSAFALTRSMYRPDTGTRPVLYAHVAGVTTVAIARGASCQFTRVSPVGLELLAARLAEREGVSTSTARERLVGFDSSAALDETALGVLDTGLAELADDLEKTIAFYSSQADGANVAEIVISGPAATIPNFAEVLGQRMSSPVRPGAPIASATPEAIAIPLERVALAAGLAVEEVPV